MVVCNKMSLSDARLSLLLPGRSTRFQGRAIRFWLFLLCPFFMIEAASAELNSPLDLVTSDVAICVEVPHLDETWSRVQSSPLADRVRGFAPLLRFLDSPGMRHWQAVEDHVSRQTGSRLSVQLRRLFARSLVIAIYVPASGEPRGILIGEAEDPEAISNALATWGKLEPGGVVTNKLHRGKKYLQRKRDPQAPESAFIAVSERWFAVSDHESMIHDVIDRFLLLSGTVTESSASHSLTQHPSFVRNRERLSREGVAYVHVNARPWDRGLEEVPQDPADLIKVIDVWKKVSAVSGCLRLDGGIVCESEIELETSGLTSEWSKQVLTASKASTWTARIPNGALLALSGGIEVAPLIQVFMEHASSEDPEGFAKMRRMGRSVFGGTDVLNSVLPALCRDFGGYLTVRRDARRSQMSFDGAMGFAADFPAFDKLDEGLGAMLSLLAVYLSAETPEIVTVERSHKEGVAVRALSESARFPLAYGFVPESPGKLVIAGSESQLIRAINPLTESDTNHRFNDHAARFFPGMNQLIWFDAAETRQVLSRHGSELANSLANGSHEEDLRISKRFEQITPFLGLVDSLFISGRVDTDHVRIVLGCGLDSDPKPAR